MSKLNRLFDEHGQSMWYDNIARDLLESGSIQALVDNGVRGLTSNPAIFKKAITSGTVYDAQLRELADKEKSATEIYEAMAVTDIQKAADILRPVYDESGGTDGFVSLEVNPLLANSTEETIEEAKRLWKQVDRPNLMIKIPGTEQGLPAIEQMLYEGYNINITLLFSRDRYAEVMDRYLNALKRRMDEGQPIDSIASVASFFVSRVDVLVDGLIDEKVDVSNDPDIKQRLKGLRGKIGIANAKMAYQLFKEKFSGELWDALKAEGAQLQRPLWASTSTKDPAYPDTLYVDNLIGPHTVNTAPPHTIEAWRDHGRLDDTLEVHVDVARAELQELRRVGIDMEEVTDQLLEEGVDKFEKPYRELLDAIQAKRDELVAA